MKKQFMKIVQTVFNLSFSDDEDVDNLSMPDMLKELLKDMKEAEKSVTMSMAMVGQKRLKLKRVLAEHDGFMAKAEELERQGDSNLAKAAVEQAVALNSEIEQLTTEVQQLDLQAQNEIVAFKDLEKTAEKLKGEIQRAQQLERFNQIRERVGTVAGTLGDGLVQKIESKVEAIELQSGQIAAQMALRKEKMEAAHVNLQIDAALAGTKAEDAYKALKEKVAAGELPESKEVKALPDAADNARALLNSPAFGDTIVNVKARK